MLYFYNSGNPQITSKFLFLKKEIGEKMTRKDSISKRKECPDCGNQAPVRDSETGETVCAYCGLVLEELELNRGRERRFFKKDTREERDKKQRTEIHRGLPTQIGPGYDRRGRSIPPSHQTRRLRKWQRRVAAKDRSTTQGFSLGSIYRAKQELDRLSYKLGIPTMVSETAMVIYKRAAKKGLVRGRSVNAMIAAALYVAWRMAQIPRDPKELSELSPVGKKEIDSNYRLLRKELDLRVPLAKHSIHIERIGGKLNVSMNAQQLAWEILKKAQKKGITAGKDPKGLAGTVLYIACLLNDEKITQNETAEAAGVTEVTIRNRYKDLKKNLEIDIEREKGKVQFQYTAKTNQDLERFSKKLAIPSFIEKEALSIVETALEADLLLNKKSNAFALICLYAACQLLEFPRHIKFFSRIGEIGEKEILNGYQILVQHLNLQIPDTTTLFITEQIAQDA